MKRKKALPLAVMFVIAVVICACYFVYTSEEKSVNYDNIATAIDYPDSCDTAKIQEDSISDVEQTSAPLPEFLNKVANVDSWYATTLCVINGRGYYYAYNDYGRSRVIYTTDEVLCEDPTLLYTAFDTSSGTKFHVSTSYKTDVIDFSDEKSVQRLKQFASHMNNTKRFSKDYSSRSVNASYHLEVDYPKHNDKLSNNVYKCLVQIINESLDNEVDVPSPNDIYIGYKKANHSNWRYKGNIRDVNAIGKFASERYFAIQKAEHCDDPEGQSISFNCLSLRQIATNGKYYSYQKQTYMYDGGAHGFPTESVVSFDAVRGEQIDWDYLFVPGSKEKVTALLNKAARADLRFRQNKEDSSLDETVVLHRPGLSETGVVFSFQPYEIDCYVNGSYHFTIPFEDIMPYLTSKAKSLLGAKV